MRCSRPGRAGDRPRAGQGLLVAQVGPELRGALGAVLGRPGCGWARSRSAGSIVGQVGDLGDPPRLGAVGEVAVGEQHHRRAVGDRDPGGLEGGVEAVAGGARRHDRHRRLAVAPEHRLQQVGLLGLGRQPGGRAAALDVDDQQRQLGHHREADRLGLQRDARAGGRGDAQRAGERRADGGAHAGDLVLGLERRDAERLVLAQLVEDVGGRGDRVGAQEDRQPGLHARGDQAVGQRQVAGDVAVGAGGHRGRLDLVGDHERLGGLAEVPAAGERPRRWRRGSSATLAKRLCRNAIVDSVGRPYIQDSSPSANMFLARAASLRDRPNSLTASTVIPVRSTRCTAKSASSADGDSSSSGLAA